MKITSCIILVIFTFTSTTLPSIGLAEAVTVSSLEMQLQHAEIEIAKKIPQDSPLNAKQIVNEVIQSYTKVLRSYSSEAELFNELDVVHNPDREELLYVIQLLQFDTKLHNQLQRSGRTIIQQAMDEATQKVTRIAPNFVPSLSFTENETLEGRPSGPPREVFPIDPSDPNMNPDVNPEPGVQSPPSDSCNGIWAWVLWLLCVIILPGGSVICTAVWLWICTRAS